MHNGNKSSFPFSVYVVLFFTIISTFLACLILVTKYSFYCSSRWSHLYHRTCWIWQSNVCHLSLASFHISQSRVHSCKHWQVKSLVLMVKYDCMAPCVMYHKNHVRRFDHQLISSSFKCLSQGSFHRPSKRTYSLAKIMNLIFFVRWFVPLHLTQFVSSFRDSRMMRDDAMDNDV